MITHTLRKSLLFPTTLACSLVLSSAVHATIVEFQTSLGPIQVNLFDQTTPKTVENFLTYLDEGHYTNSVIHRAIPEFIVQGGGFEFNGEWPLTALTPNASVINEPFYSNVKGTIAMAKVANNPNSATDQWFFNLEDNNDTQNVNNLDRQNSGFTVFGQVIGDGMAIIEAIAQLKLCNYGDLEAIPMVVDYTDQECTDLLAPGIANFVIVDQITIIDSSPVTDSGLNPLLTKYPDSDGDGVKDVDDAFPSDPTKWAAESPSSSGSGGGSITWFSLVMLAFVSIRKRLINS